MVGARRESHYNDFRSFFVFFIFGLFLISALVSEILCDNNTFAFELSSLCVPQKI